MGAYFLVVNPAKRQYLDPTVFEIKFEPLLRGDYCLLALKMLIADPFRRDESSFSGAWLGDPDHPRQRRFRPAQPQRPGHRDPGRSREEPSRAGISLSSRT